MFRRNFVLFIQRHKYKIMIIIRFILLLISISFIATIITSTISKINLYTSQEDNTNNTTTQQQTIIYGYDVDKETYVSDEEVIDKFIKYCNQGKTKQAYNMLTDDCKNTYYATEKEFKQLYQQQIFYVSKTYDLQSWIINENKNTYKVKIITDNFDMGKYDDSDYIEEYYTVVTENSNKKISINRYINKESINKSIKNSKVKFTIIEKDVYMDYEIYKIELENYTKQKIKLDSKETVSSIYLLDTEDVVYSSFIHELTDNDLTIEPGKSKVIKIKFNKMYNPDVIIQSINFNDIRINNEIYTLNIQFQ